MMDRCYGTLVIKVGSHFVHLLNSELQGVWAQRWNAGRFIVFQIVILQHAYRVFVAQEIIQRIDKRLHEQ